MKKIGAGQKCEEHEKNNTKTVRELTINKILFVIKFGPFIYFIFYHSKTNTNSDKVVNTIRTQGCSLDGAEESIGLDR